uniref:Uncharacterized protein n=1 Tax=Arundo donax TaxID=35708 RepID=A0A0A9FUD4_ARUDO
MFLWIDSTMESWDKLTDNTMRSD